MNNHNGTSIYRSIVLCSKKLYIWCGFACYYVNKIAAIFKMKSLTQSKWKLLHFAALICARAWRSWVTWQSSSSRMRVSHETASSSAECRRDKPPFSFVRGQDSTMWDIVWVSPQISVCKSPFPSVGTAVSLFHAKTVQQRPLLPREVETWHDMAVISAWSSSQ